jgi:hypothetical protein
MKIDLWFFIAFTAYILNMVAWAIFFMTRS